MRHRLVFAAVGLSAVLAHAGPPKPIVELAAAVDGAKRSDGKKECAFTIEKPACALAVKVSCATPLMKYSYVMTLPVSKLDPKKSVYQANAGGFSGSHGVEVTAQGDVIETITDDGQKSTGEVVVLAFGNSADDEKRAKKFVATLAAAKKACR
jgi:hypothetical protein